MTFPPNTDANLTDAISRWQNTYDPAAFEVLGFPADELRLILDRDTTLNVYQGLLAKNKSLIYQVIQFSEDAWSKVFNRVDTIDNDGLSFIYHKFLGSLARAVLEAGMGSLKAQLYAVIDGYFYVPTRKLIPGYTVSGVDREAQGLGEFFVSTNESASGPFVFAWVVSQINLLNGKGETPFTLENDFAARSKLVLLKFSSTGWPLQYFDGQSWQFYPFSRDPNEQLVTKPILVAPAIDIPAGIAITPEVANEVIVQSGMFKPHSQYLLIGDEPRDASVAVLDLKTLLPADDVQNLMKFLTMMPRSMLYSFFMEKIWPSLPWTMDIGPEVKDMIGRPKITSEIYGETHTRKEFETLVWSAFIDLFNEANLAYINEHQLTPWDWEQKKTDAYYVSSSADALAALQDDLQAYQNVTLALDPKAKVIMEAYAGLPKLGDLGLEINRQNAIKELLKAKDYNTAQAIVDAYRYASDTVLGEALEKPIPFDIVAADKGTVIKATPI